MKKKLKNLFYLSLLLSGLIFVGCELQEDVIEEHNHQHELKLSQKRFHELLQDKNFITAFNKIPKQKVLTTNALGRTQLEDKYGFTIFNTPVNVMESDTLIAYNLLIKRDVASQGSYVENLVMNIFPQKNRTDAYIIKYVFDGTTEINPENFFELEKKNVVTPIVFNNEPFDEVAKQSMTCIRVQEFQCCILGGKYKSCHPPDSGGCVGNWMTVDVLCNTTGGSGGGYDYSGVGGGPPDPHQGGSNGNTHPVYNNPTPPCDPRVDCPVLEDTTQIGNTPCDIIKKLQKDINFKNRMKGLISASREWNFETGYGLYNAPTPISTNNYTYNPFSGTIASPFAVYGGNTLIQGVIHTHFISPQTISIFSAGDLQDLYEKMKNPLITGDFFIAIVTEYNTAYLLQVSNRADFIAFGSNYLSSDSKTDDFMKRIMGNKYGIKSSNSNQSNELKFLRMMKELNMGLSLASADFDASTTLSPVIFNTWTKKEYNSQTNDITPSNCN